MKSYTHRYSLLIFLACSATLAWAGSSEFRVPPGGVPPFGSGPVTIDGEIRVVDATHYEISVKGQQVGVRLIGIDAPAGNTACGKQAAQIVESLLRIAGPLKFDEDAAQVTSSRKLKQYYLSKGGQSIAAALVQAGMGIPDGQGNESNYLKSLLDNAKQLRAGCLWNPASKASSNTTSTTVASTAIPSAFALQAPAAEAATTALAPMAASISNTSLPNGFVQDVVVSGLYLPTAFAFLPDGRILVAQQNGIVRIFKNGALLNTPFIDLSDRVNSFWDRGMIGLAVDINFAANGYVYLMYVYENDANDYTGPKTARLVRVTTSGDIASPSTETILVGKLTGSTCHNFAAGADCLSADAQSHSVGNIRATSDGTLWATMGDGGSFTVVDDDSLRAQDITSLNGKVLHITTSGAGLPGNPFWNGDPNANQSKVYATGMRNSFRFNLRPGTLTPYLGEVGWGTYDEVNVGNPGANFGWPCYEGRYVQSGYEDKPVCQALYAKGVGAVTFSLTEWYHGGTSAASVGGAFYVGSAYPAEYQGSYFYGDYAQNLIRNLRVDGSNVLIGGPYDFATSADGPSQIETGPDQNVYYLALNSGELRRVRYVASADITPPAVVSSTPSANSTAGGVDSDILVIFNEGMDPASVTAANFRLVKQSSGSSITTSVTYSVVDRTARVHPSVTLDNGTQYGVTVVGGAGGVADVAGNPLPANFAFLFSTVALPPSGTSFLSDLGSVSTTNGYGPVERDQSNGDIAAGDGHTLTLRGTTYAKGIGVHATSEIHYSLGGSCTNFKATVGVDDEATTFGTVVFQVLLDGVKVFDSGKLLGGGATSPVNLDLTGKNDLALLTQDAGDGNSWDHGDWANATLTCSGGSLGAPSLGSTIPVNGATNISVTVSPKVTFSKAVTSSTVTPANFTLQKQGTTTALPATVSYDPVTRTATLQPLSVLQAGTTYVASVKGGSTGVKDTNGTTLATTASWSFTTSTQSFYTKYLSDLTWTSATNGWGPVEKDMSNGENGTGDGRPLTLRGTVFAKGLGAHAASVLSYNLGGACTVLNATIGIDDEVGANGSVTFQVVGDGVSLYQSGLMFGATPAKNVEVDISGRDQIQLVLRDGGDNTGFDHGDWADAKVTCNVTNSKPAPVIASPVGTNQYKVGDVITYSGSATDTEDGAIPSSALAWSIIIHHCPGGVCHTHPFLSSTGTGGSFTIPDHGDDSYFELLLTASDSGGLSNTASVSLQPKTVQITLQTSPPGLQVIYGGDRGTSPYTRTTIIGSSHSVLASSPQGNLVFSSWSDGGTPQHNVTIGSSNVTYTANFVTSNTGLLTRYLSDIPWTSALNGSGPVERDKSNGGAALDDGTSINLKGIVFGKGLGASAVSDIRFNLGGTCSNFSATVGVDNEVAPNGSINFTVVLDGVQVFSSGLMTAALDPQTLSVNTSGKNELALQISDGGNGNAGDHGDWANAILTCSADSTAPVAQSTVPANNGTGVSPAASISATFSEPMGASTFTTNSFQLVKQGTTTPVPAAVTYDRQSNTAVLSPNSGLTSGVYTATISGGSGGVADLAGNLLAATKIWTFSVGDTTAPTVLSTVPVSNAGGIAATATISATFSEQMLASTVSAATFSVVKQSTGTAVSGAITYSSAANTATFTPNTGLQPGAVYTATVIGGPSGAGDLAGNRLATNYIWSFTVAASTSNSTIYVSDLPWSSSTNGWGPVERDKSNGEVAPGDGRPISLQGTVFTKGIGAHAASEVQLNLAGSCSSFLATVGVDDEVGPNGTVIFKVIGDGNTLFTSGLAVGGGTPQTINLSVAGVNQLSLQLGNSGDNNGSDHADWANARLLCAAEMTAPTVQSITPASGATEVATSASVSVLFSEPMLASSITTSTISMTKSGSSLPVSASISYDVQTSTAKLIPASALEAGATYTVTVSGVKDLNANPIAASRTSSFTTTATAQSFRFISDLPWISSSNGWGPVERDKSNGEQSASDGVALNLGGVTYAKGLGVHAVSDIQLTLGGACSRFTAVVGIDNEIAPNGSIVFNVLADGASIYTSGVLTGTSVSKSIDIGVAGKTTLELQVTDAGDGSGADHGDWANAKLQCNLDSTAPTISSTTPTSAATGVVTTASVNAVFSEPISAATLNPSSFTLVKQGSTAVIAATIVYNPQTLSAQLKTTAALASATNYTATLKGGTNGVKDLAGNPLPADKIWSFTTR